jgi:hypothetical protein
MNPDDAPPVSTCGVVKRALVLLALVLTSQLLTAPPVTAATVSATGTETDLGVQIPGKVGSVRSEQSAQGTLADGRYLAFFANNGTSGVPARFLAMDLTGRTVAQLNIPLGTSVQTLVYSPKSRTVFVASNAASTTYLYEWDGRTLTRRATLSGHLAMRMVAASDGSVFIGTFAPSNGRLYRWSGGVLKDLGQPMAGESYVRSLAVDSTSVWVSNYRQGAARLVRVNRSTNARTAVAVPSAFKAQWSAMHMTRAGDFLFLRTVDKPFLFAYDVRNARFATFDDQVARVHTAPEVTNRVAYINGISPYAISPAFEGRYVYFQRSGAGIMRIDLLGGLKTVRVDRYNAKDNTVSWPGASVAGPMSYAWKSGVAGRSGYSLVTTTIDGKVVVNTRGQSAPHTLTLQTQAAPSTIIRLGTDEAGNVYSGGFDLPAGVGQRRPDGTRALLPGPQVEGFGRYGSQVVMGGYTGSATASAPLYLYDGTGSPVLKTHLGNSQERPVAIQQVGSKVAVGSVPIKNTLGGALSIWDPATGALEVRRDIIAKHSVVSLSVHRKWVVAGSSNVGGTGTTPTATSGRIFTYDPSTKVMRTFVPPRASTATYSWVAAITPDPSTPGRFWAISTGYLIQFRVADDGTITLTRNLGAFPGTSSPTGKELGIAFVDGTMYATLGGALVAVDPSTGTHRQVAAKTAAGAVVGLVESGGDLYFARGPRLYRYTPTPS